MTYLHQRFLSANHIESETLEYPIQTLIRDFNRLVESADQEDEEDRTEIEEHLNSLDQEIYVMLLDEYQDELENNETLDPDEDETNDFNLLTKNQQASQAANEQILENLLAPALAQGKTKVINISRSFLQERGFSVKLKNKVHIIGRYMLRRESSFRYCYTLTLK